MYAKTYRCPRYENDKEVKALYICLREISHGASTRQIELQEGVYLDADEEGRTHDIEFLEIENSLVWLDHHGGRVRIPEHFAGLSPA